MMHKLIAGAVTRQSGMWRLVAVCALVLATLLPSLAMAAAPVSFSAGGQITSISDGTVKPAGDSGRFVVVERKIVGTLDPDGSLSGDFVLTYKANVELATQAGNLHGTVKVSGNVLNVNGKIDPRVFVGPYGLPYLHISGHWN
ncbi:MAG: hypothetical protein Q7O66_11080, partial [Dehalococcoidia bacterium]|nr:hypothetical protein [Dehalococcoidia bacterium]